MATLTLNNTWQKLTNTGEGLLVTFSNTSPMVEYAYSQDTPTSGHVLGVGKSLTEQITASFAPIWMRTSEENFESSIIFDILPSGTPIGESLFSSAYSDGLTFALQSIEDLINLTSPGASKTYMLRVRPQYDLDFYIRELSHVFQNLTSGSPTADQEHILNFVLKYYSADMIQAWGTAEFAITEIQSLIKNQTLQLPPEAKLERYEQGQYTLVPLLPVEPTVLLKRTINMQLNKVGSTQNVPERVEVEAPSGFFASPPKDSLRIPAGEESGIEVTITLISSTDTNGISSGQSVIDVRAFSSNLHPLFVDVTPP